MADLTVHQAARIRIVQLQQQISELQDDLAYNQVLLRNSQWADIMDSERIACINGHFIGCFDHPTWIRNHRNAQESLDIHHTHAFAVVGYEKEET